MVAGTHSGAGKTTVATGLLAALKAAGHHPAAAKVGPDFIDPGYHALACGRPPRNLDAWLCGLDAIRPLTARAAAGADLLVVEGVMGLFDGAADGSPSSTADIARQLDAPILLVVDAASQSSSVAAVVHGFATLDPTVRLGGVVLNRVASDGHEVLLREALAPLGVPVLGALRRDDRLVWRDRHLGLVPVAERPDEVAASLAALAAAVADRVDLAAVVALARSAPPLTAGPVALPGPDTAARPTRVAVAGGRAFTFTYTDTLDAVSAAGAEVFRFDPLRDEALPADVDGLLVGGGFPETYAAALAANRALLDDVRRRVTAGLPTWAECGGLTWLCRDLDGHPMAGVLAATATMGDRLHLGYRTARTTVATPLGPAGTELRGHEFHYSTIDPPGAALDLSSRFNHHPDGHATPSLMATYLHHHPGGDPSIVANFVAACAASVRG
ncbi:MAG: cobyrinic acid a,c-diamide synthase [Actinomycetota bacterium]|nr:cobyrinic acid a,c-diamide synthase [Actinomycetota bacterium]